jgi:hypothetical protein
MIFPRLDDRAEKGSKSNEGPGIGKKDLRQVQGDYPRRRGTRHLREPEAQAASGISKPWQGRETSKTGIRFQGSGIRKRIGTAAIE